MRFFTALFFFWALFASSLHAEDERGATQPLVVENGYTINYDTVSIVEYIRFASKICSINFLFDTEDLDFAVTVVSDAPITPQNVMATLLQTLRIHGLELLEQGNSLVIHKATGVQQIAQLVTEKGQEKSSPIVTRVFRVSNLKPDSIAAIIRPMISTASILEVSPETHQLILTDITANVDKVAALIEVLDSPYNPLEVHSYQPLYNSPTALVALCNQIMQPLTQGNPFTLVVQQAANFIFVVSTPNLVAQALSTLQTLDIPPASSMAEPRKLKGDSIFVYKPLNRSPTDLLTGLKEIEANLRGAGIAEGDLIDTISSGRVVSESHSLLFVGSKDSIVKLKEFLETLDMPGKESVSTKTSFFIYKPLYRSAQEIESSIQEMGINLQQSKGVNPALIEALQSSKVNQATNTLTFSGEESQFSAIKEMLATIDIPGEKKATPPSKRGFYLYKLNRSSFEELQASLKTFSKGLNHSNVDDEGLIETIDEMQYIPETQSILFSGSETALKRIKELAPLFDATTVMLPVSNEFYTYKPRYQRGDQIVHLIKELTADLKEDRFADPAFLRTLESARFIKATNTFLFTGDNASLKKVETLLVTLDVPSMEKPTEKVFYLYTPPEGQKEKTENYLNQLANSLDRKNEAALIETIRSMKWIDVSQSLLFQGTDPSIQRLKDLLSTFASSTPIQAPTPKVEKAFYLYTPSAGQKEKTENYLAQLANSLDRENEAALIETIHSMQWIDASQSFLFQGTDPSIQRLKDLLSTFASSTPIQAPTPKAEKVFYIYTPSAGQKEKTENYLTQLANSLDRENEAALIETIHSMQWIDASQSFLFQGTDPSIQRLKDLLSTFASSTPIQAPTPKTGYSIYKLQNATVDQMEEDLDKLAKDLSETTVSDKNLIAAIEQIRYVKETNSLLLTGDATVIEELKNIIAQYDHPQTATEPVNSDFFMYKPQHLQAQEIEKSLQDIGSSLQQAGLADASLLRAISSAKYVATTNSIIFTGNTESLQKIQTLLQEIDVPPKTHAPIQHVGKTTFLLYKLKHAGGTQIVSAIRSMEEDLKKSGNADKEFLAALDSMKYVKETNSLLFTGTEPALTKVEALLSGYDVTSLAAPAPAEKPTPSPASTNFFVYRPTAVPGVELERMVYDFAENLKMSGLSDPDLFNAIASMRWVEKTQSLIFTGTPRSLEQIQTLLKDFDNPANLREEAPSGTAIQAIDNTSFLVYKLQFHRGDEIQSALRQIAKDLANTNAPVNQNLLHAIQSIQWLDVTNSLLCSGDQETLTRLKELIKNLDIPLKQVFIEILVIETSLTNALNFGLEWGANYNFNNKFGASSYNTLPPPNAQSVFPDTFITNLGKLEPPATPTPIGNIPANVGFDLGVIGEVIKHNGQTFLTLGSLLTALQQDTETTIVNTPKILAQDGRTSVFFSGSNIPFTGSFVNNTQSGATIQTSNLEYRDIGLKLMITPVLGNSDIVTLDINLDREQTATDINQTALNFSSQTANGIVTSKTSMQTTVHVPDRNFLVLSGFVNNSNTKQKSGIPCLGGLPLIGAAFSKSNDTISSQNIVIFLRPYILNSIEDMRKMTAEQEEYFREQSPTPFLEHNYNDSLELLKTIDDD